jgi:hypothetical protein
MESGREQLGVCVDNINLLEINRKNTKTDALLVAYREACLDGVLYADQILCSRLANITAEPNHNTKIDNTHTIDTMLEIR